MTDTSPIQRLAALAWLAAMAIPFAMLAVYCLGFALLSKAGALPIRIGDRHRG